MLPRFRTRHCDKQYSFPIYYEQKLKSINTIILQGLTRMSRDNPSSGGEAQKYLIYIRQWLPCRDNGRTKKASSWDRTRPSLSGRHPSLNVSSCACVPMCVTRSRWLSVFTST